MPCHSRTKQEIEEVCGTTTIVNCTTWNKSHGQYKLLTRTNNTWTINPEVKESLQQIMRSI